ncbi:MAG: Glu-tRNA(Gln) amidotransferase subunit GatE [Candidatus Korarchaeota archaeon]|nr:Glu-tRNA(Gln) amidotransferase subunit GatE [Candidatus Korarchaeota archaeon]
MDINYEKVGLKVGLEIHQRLDTHKLFCSCPSIMREDEPHEWIRRRLSVSYSELGTIDPAARFESLRKRDFLYGIYYDTTCEVEADEAPPHPMNEEALEISLTIALMLGMEPVDEVHVMRKIVVDGSNTTGFQRTALVALGGEGSGIETKWGRVRMATLCLEEESAYIVESKPERARYRLDRLGIPLVELATEPDIMYPEQAREAALKLGRILRATGKVQRGLGTIRQDINVSIEGGARQEIKGVQDLDLIPEIIRREVMRQLNLLSIRDELRSRDVKEEDLDVPIVDVTSAFSSSKSKLITKALSRGEKVYGIKVKGFSGILGKELQPGRRFGTELADYAKVFGGVKGILHGDELPSYGIGEDEVNEVRELLGCDEGDSFVLVLGREDAAKLALDSVRKRLKQALRGVPNETRRALPDGNTAFMRPMPGSARMYPETDVMPVNLRPVLERIKGLPPMPEDQVRELMERYDLTEELAWEIFDEGKVELFEKLSRYGVPTRFLASMLVSMVRSLKREGEPVENLREEHFEEIAKLLGEGSLAKEAVPEVLRSLSRGEYSRAEEYVKTHRMSVDELDKVIEQVLEKLSSKVRERGERAYGMVMGEVMKEVRGKIDGSIVSKMVKKKLEEFLKAR